MEELTTEQIEAKVSKSIEKNKATTSLHILKLKAKYNKAEGSEKIRLQALIDRHTAYKEELDATVINDLVQTSLAKQTDRLAVQAKKLARLAAIQQEKSKHNLPLPDISKSKLPK